MLAPDTVVQSAAFFTFPVTDPLPRNVPSLCHGSVNWFAASVIYDFSVGEYVVTSTRFNYGLNFMIRRYPFPPLVMFW